MNSLRHCERPADEVESVQFRDYAEVSCLAHKLPSVCDPGQATEPLLDLAF